MPFVPLPLFLRKSRLPLARLCVLMGMLVGQGSALGQAPPPRAIDLDQDGVPDSVLRQVRANPDEPVWGRIVVQSGAGGDELLSIVAPEANDLFGWVTASIGDIDNDGIGDVAVAAPRGRTPLPGIDSEEAVSSGALGRVYLIAGADGSIIRSLRTTDLGYFGFALRTTGDFDGDTLHDLLVAGMHWNGEVSETDALILEPCWALMSTNTGAVLLSGEGTIGPPFRSPAFTPRVFWRLGTIAGARTVEFGLSGDVDADGVVCFFDLLWLLAHWGGDPGAPGRSHPNASRRGDIDGSGAVAFADLVRVLEQYGQRSADPASPTRGGGCWDYCSCHPCEMICPDDMDCECEPPCGGGCGPGPCCGDPCCLSGDTCSLPCGGPCNPSCPLSSGCDCNPFGPGCAGSGGLPYPGDGGSGGGGGGHPCDEPDPCDCDDDGDGQDNRDDPDSSCFEKECGPAWTSIGRLILTVRSAVRLDHNPPPLDPLDPKKSPVVWVNTDDDNQNGTPDYSDMGPIGADVRVDFEDDLIPLRFEGSFCGNEPRWQLDAYNDNLWYEASGPDLRDQVHGEPWPQEDCRERIAGGKRMRRVPLTSGITPLFDGSPKAWSGKLFIEPVYPTSYQGDHQISLYYSAEPPAGGSRQSKQARIRLTAIELEVHDLRYWGPTYDPVSGNPGVLYPDLDTGSLQVGGAITDGASICLLRAKILPDAYAAPLLDMTVEMRKRNVQSPSSTEVYEPPAWIAGVFAPYATLAGGQPLLPALPTPEADTFPNSVNGTLTERKLFYVPPEAYTDPTFLAVGSPPSAFLNSSEACLMTFRGTVNNRTIPGGRSFVLRRPPLVLVHGIMSSPATWGTTAYSELAGTPVPTRLYYADYSATATKGYSENFHVVPETIASALSDYRTANDGNHHSLRRFNGIRYAATRADVIGHSQGGQLARTFISSLDWTDIGTINRTRDGVQTIWPPATFFRTGTFGDRRYLRSDNWGAGDIRRLVTIGSPFKGSPIANELEPWLEPTTFNLGFHETMEDDILPGASFWQYLYVGGGVAFGNYIDPTCIADLCADSRVQSLLEDPTAYPGGQRNVPWAPMVGIVTQSVGNAPVQSVLWELLYTFTPGLPNDPFEIEPLSPTNCDLIVPQWSQMNAVDEADTPNANFPWRFEYHSHFDTGIPGLTGETQSDMISQQIGDLLSRPRSHFLNGVLH